MIRLRITLLIALLAALLSACTRHNGDIGDYFGTWHVETVTADGVELPLYSDDGVLVYEWRFQAGFIQIQTIYPHLEYDRCFGTWREAGGHLLLDFSHSDSGGVGEYTPPAALHLSEGVTDMDIISLSSSRLVTAYVDHQGVKYTYHLRKTY